MTLPGRYYTYSEVLRAGMERSYFDRRMRAGRTGAIPNPGVRRRARLPGLNAAQGKTVRYHASLHPYSWDLTDRDDGQILSRAGIRSRAYTAGPHSPRERPPRAFDEMAAGRE